MKSTRLSSPVNWKKRAIAGAAIVTLGVTAYTKANAIFLVDLFFIGKAAMDGFNFVKKQTLSVDVNIFEHSSDDGLRNAKFSCGQSLPLSFRTGQYLGVTRCRADLSSAKVLSSSEMAMVPSLGLHAGQEIAFVQPLESQLQVTKQDKRPKLRFPVNADIVKNKMQPGDLVAFKTDMDMSVGLSEASKIWNLKPDDARNFLTERISSIGFNGSLGFALTMRGQVLINVYRMKENRVRLRLTGNLGTTVGGGLNLNPIALRPLEIAAWGWLDNRIQSRVIGGLASNIGGHHNKSNIYVADYVLNLNTEGGVKAYNELFSLKSVKELFTETGAIIAADSRKSLNDKSVASPMKISSLEMMAKMAQEDLELGSRDSRKRASQISYGRASVESQISYLNLNLLFLKLSASNGLTKMRFSLTNPKGELNHYLYAAINESTSREMIFDLDSKSDMKSVDTIARIDEQGMPIELKALTFTWQRTQGDFDENDYTELKRQAFDVFPISQPIWPAYPNKKSGGAYLQTEQSLVIPKLDDIMAAKSKQSSQEEVDQAIRDSVKRYYETQANVYPSGGLAKDSIDKNVVHEDVLCHEDSGIGSPRNFFKCPDPVYFAKDRDYVAKLLSVALTPWHTPQERLEKFEQLAGVPLFRFNAYRLINFVLDKKLIDNNSYFTLRFNAREFFQGSSMLIHQYPDPAESPRDSNDLLLRREIDDAKAALNGYGEYDLRIYEDESGQITSRQTGKEF